MNQRGKFIIIEGVDGSGKTTAVKILKEQLEIDGKPVKMVNILQDNAISAKIRALLTTPGNIIHPDAETCLYAAAVTNTYREEILPLLEKGVNVLCDRSHLSTLAYQIAPQRNAGNTRPEAIFKAVYDGIAPDVLLVLSIDPEDGLDRVKQRDGKLDRIEMRGPEYIKQVQQAYLNYCDSVSGQQPVFTYHNNGSLEKLSQYVVSIAKQI